MALPGRKLRVTIWPSLGGVNMTLANVIEVAILVAVVVVAIRFFMRRD